MYCVDLIKHVQCSKQSTIHHAETNYTGKCIVPFPDVHGTRLQYAMLMWVELQLLFQMAVRRAFRDNRQLQQFVLPDVTPTGNVLGRGSYGLVREVSLLIDC